MSIPYSSLQKIPLAYASCSIGCSSSDTLPRRLQAISEAGFTAIELSFPDILDFGEQITGQTIAPDNYPEILPVASDIRKLCEEYGLSIMMLQPFSNFEGWVKGSMDREEAFARATGWMEVMNVVGTDLMQVRHSYIPIPRFDTALENQGHELKKKHIRSEQQTHQKQLLRPNATPSSPTYGLYRTSLQNGTSALRTRIGAGQPMRRGGREYGRLSKLSIARIAGCAWIRSRRRVVNGVIRLPSLA